MCHFVLLVEFEVTHVARNSLVSPSIRDGVWVWKLLYDNQPLLGGWGETFVKASLVLVYDYQHVCWRSARCNLYCDSDSHLALLSCPTV